MIERFSLMWVMVVERFSPNPCAHAHVSFERSSGTAEAPNARAPPIGLQKTFWSKG